MPAVAVLLLSALIGVPPSAHPSAMEGGRLLSFDEFHKKIVEERALREGKVDVTDAIRKDRRNERHLLPFAMDAARIACEHVLNARKADIDAHGNETLYYPDVVACDREFAGDGGVFEAEMLSNTLRKPLTLAQLHDVRTDSMADDVDINYDVMKAWTCEQAAAYFESGGTDAPRKTPFADKHVTTCAELLEAVGLLPLEEAISCSPEAPLTLAKIASWAFNGRMTLHERLRAAGVAQLADRKVLIDAIEDAMAAESLVPDQNEKAPCVDPKYPEPAAASVAPGVRVGDGLIKLPDGRRVAYREYGQADGYPIFFLHGNVSCRLFEPMYAESDSVSKAVGARIIAFDRPGIGGSDPHPGRSYATAAADLAAIAGALGLAPRSYAILGFSSGAVHTLASLSLRPGDAAAYGMMSTDGPYWMMRQEPKGSLGKTAVDDAPGSMAEACEKTTALAGMIQEMVEFFVPEGAMRKAALADIAEASKQGVQPMAEDYWMERIDWGFLRESTNRKVWRNLLMWQGTRDEAVHPESAKYLAKLLPGAKLTILDGYSHDDVPRRDWKGILEQLMAKARD